MAIELVFITYNRLKYTKLALASIIADPEEEFSLVIWDNASTDGTVEYLKHEVNDSRISDIIFSNENVGQISAVNEIWSKSRADLVGKLDNDCLMTPGWTRTLAKAHQDIDNLGVVACWHFSPEDFDYARAMHKIQQFNNHRILRHAWTCGTGFLIKRDTFRKFGPIQGNATTKYWLRIATAGYINGFYYPLIYQEHMDYPWSEHYAYFDNLEKGFERAATARKINIRTIDEARAWHKTVVENVLSGPLDHKYYIGWRARLRRTASRASKMFIHRVGKDGNNSSG
ncbi:MAG: glycosyltransferase family 2 protein [Sedimentisphaerales bacterium]|nr:glycosyltransferase family 2 protein [Sedimentisphaerales bacterium]